MSNENTTRILVTIQQCVKIDDSMYPVKYYMFIIYNLYTKALQTNLYTLSSREDSCFK